MLLTVDIFYEVISFNLKGWSVDSIQGVISFNLPGVIIGNSFQVFSTEILKKLSVNF